MKYSKSTETDNTWEQLPWEIKTIIYATHQLRETGKTTASTGERIAAAFVLNDMNYLPANYRDAVEAWERLDSKWQGYVRTIKDEYMYFVEVDEPD